MKTFALHILLLLSLSSSQVTGQNNSKDEPLYYLHSLADTVANPTYKPYINLWIEFLYTEDDSIRRTYWNPDDIITKKDDYALFYSSLFQYPASSLLGYFKPYILSVYFDNDICHITTAFWNFNFMPSDSSALLNSNPFAILEVGIVKKDNKMYLTNLFEKRTESWKKFTNGKINYIFEPSLEPDFSDITNAHRYTDSLSKLFSINFDSINFIVCKTPQTLGYILGFNFFYSGFTLGKTFFTARTIISGRGTFNYPHELTHVILDPYLKPGHFFSEGLATFFGGSIDKSYKQLVLEFKKKYSAITNKEFDEITKYHNSTTFYTLSALAVEVIYKKFGIEGLKKLSECPDSPDEALSFVQNKMSIDKQTLFKEINANLKAVKE